MFARAVILLLFFLLLFNIRTLPMTTLEYLNHLNGMHGNRGNVILLAKSHSKNTIWTMSNEVTLVFLISKKLIRIKHRNYVTPRIFDHPSLQMTKIDRKYRWNDQKLLRGGGVPPSREVFDVRSLTIRTITFEVKDLKVLIKGSTRPGKNSVDSSKSIFWNIFDKCDSDFSSCLILLILLTIFMYSLQILTDLVQGEFMQLGAKETENERFAHYLTKTFRKTASLIANSLKSVNIHSRSGNHSANRWVTFFLLLLSLHFFWRKQTQKFYQNL